MFFKKIYVCVCVCVCVCVYVCAFIPQRRSANNILRPNTNTHAGRVEQSEHWKEIDFKHSSPRSGIPLYSHVWDTEALGLTEGTPWPTQKHTYRSTHKQTLIAQTVIYWNSVMPRLCNVFNGASYLSTDRGGPTNGMYALGGYLRAGHG